MFDISPFVLSFNETLLNVLKELLKAAEPGDASRVDFMRWHDSIARNIMGKCIVLLEDTIGQREKIPDLPYLLPTPSDAIKTL